VNLTPKVARLLGLSGFAVRVAFRDAKSEPRASVSLGPCLLAVLVASSSGLGAAPAPTGPGGAKSSGNSGVVRFLNGDVLHGELVAIDAQRQIRWRNADIKEDFEFDARTITRMRPGERKSSRAKAPFNALLRLANGDELAGNILSLDKDKLVLETWYAGKLTLPRTSVQSMRFLSEGPSLYEGPTGLEGWTLSAAKDEPGKPPWKYLNGVLYSASAGGIARDFKLPKRASLDVDVAWREFLQLTITIYTTSLKVYSLNRMGMAGIVAAGGVVPGFDALPPAPQEGPGFYAIQLNQNTAYLMTVKTNGQILNTPMEIIPGLEQKNRARFGVRVDKDKKTISLLVDGTVFKTWTEPAEFAGQGTCVRFVQQGQSLMNMSNIKVSDWDGSLVPPPTLSTNDNPKNDFVLLKNQDSLAGTLLAVREGKLSITASFGPLDVPLPRVAQIIFAPEKLARAAPQEGAVRALFADRGSLTFHVEKCDEKFMTVSSPLFGKAQFDPSAFSLIDFNPDPQN
jgi:hypothetical protein